MIPVLAAALVILIGGRLRIRPAPRTPSNPVAGHRTASRWHRSIAEARRLGRRSPPPGPHQVALWCDDLARAVGSGSVLTTAIRTVEPPASCAATADTIRLALERGASLHDACDIDTPTRDLSLVLTVVRACAVHGGPAAEPLGRTAATLRARAAEAAERRTQSAQARMSAVVMTILPIAMLAVLLITSGSVRRFIASPAGLAVVVAGTSLNLIGWRWMARLIDGGRA